jgi:peptidyl-prolyl cis-trans isomerase C
MKQRILSIALAMTFAAAPAFAAKQASAPVKSVAVVNGVSIPASYAEAMLSAQNARGVPESADLEKAVREELIRRQLLVQQAAQKGLDKRPDVVTQMELARQGVLVGAVINNYLRSTPISEADLKKEYEAINAATGTKEYKLSHILLDSEKDAQSVLDKVKSDPSKFAELAKQFSRDNENKDNGGDLGWAPPTIYVKPFADAVAGLEKGKYTVTPVKTQFGYHIIKLDDTRDIKPPAYEQVKGQLQQRLQSKLIEQYIADLRAKATVK